MMHDMFMHYTTSSAIYNKDTSMCFAKVHILTNINEKKSARKM